MLLALPVPGPQRLPRAARQIGKFVRQVRQMSSGFQQEIRSAIDVGDQPFHPDESRIRPLPGATSLTAGSADDAQPADPDLEADIRARNDGGSVAPDERAAG